MQKRAGAIALTGILFLLTHTANGSAQSDARADIKNSQGKIVGTASLRETTDGVLITMDAKALPQGSMQFIYTQSGSVKVLPLRAREAILIRSTRKTV
jgi:hypothetical protein